MKVLNMRWFRHTGVPCLLKCPCGDVVATQRIYKHETAGVFSSVKDARGVITKLCPPDFARGKKCSLQAISEHVKAVWMT